MKQVSVESIAMPSLSTSAAPNPAARILYVEDDTTMRRLVWMVLTDAGYRVNAVEDGAAGWTALTSERFDLVITDNDLPALTGIELVAKAHQRGLTTPFILASSVAVRFAGREYDCLALAGLLQKPFSADELLSTVRRILLDRHGISKRDEGDSASKRHRPGERSAWGMHGDGPKE